MNSNCVFCDKTISVRKLKSISDENLNICERINETFGIPVKELETLTKSLICEICIKNLNISYDFCKNVKIAKEKLNNSITNDVMIKIEVKQENLENDNLDDFFFESYHYGHNEDDDDSNSQKDEEKINVDEETAKKSRGKYKTKNKKVEESDKPVRKYRKLLPGERKKNRGIRRAKEAIKIKPLDLYKNEIKNIYSDQPEHLEILAEDKLNEGKVTDRIAELYAPTAWQNYSWHCENCTEFTTFPDILQLNDHLHKVHKMKYKRRCHECQKTTHHYAACINHIIENHSSHNKFCCILCPKPEIRWNLKELFLHYQKSHSKWKIFFCIYCGLHFICGAKLKEHLINKHKRSTCEEGMFECDICGFTTDMRNKIKQHMVKHISSPAFMCDQCTVTFATSSYLSTHIKHVHSRIQIKCTKCAKLFKSERRLRVHDKAVHQTNRQFACNICHKAFYAQHRLNSHIKIHQDAAEEKFQCPHCERRFKYKPGMNYHIRAAHTGETPYVCPIQGCNDRFYDYSNARKHITTSHKSELKPIRE